MVFVLTRLPDWQPRLRAFLRDATTRALAPGKHDCCLFGAGAIAHFRFGLLAATSCCRRFAAMLKA